MKANNFYTQLFRIIVLAFALVGAFLSFSYLAIKLRLTDEAGQADGNARYFSQIHEKYNQGFRVDSSNGLQQDFSIYERLALLNRIYPANAVYIEDALKAGVSKVEINRMLEETEIALSTDSLFQQEKQKLNAAMASMRLRSAGLSMYDWMNIAEWKDFKVAVAKDKKLIDSVAVLCAIEPRLIVACLVGEQIRLFNSNREAYKRWIGPLKILSVESQFSFGVTGIKEQTAMDIEAHLRDTLSVFFPGTEFKALLDFKTNDPGSERISRLTSFKDHFYSYMYAGLFLRQVMIQWEKSGFSIKRRPEILATLFNIGFANSKPKANPLPGGALIKIKEAEYTFGAIASQFYYSGELQELFPYQSKKFK